MCISKWLWLGLALCAPCLVAPSVQAEPLQVSLVLSEDSVPYQEFADALRAKLGGKNISFSTSTLNRPLPHAGLVVSVGSKAATALAGSDAPALLNVLISKSAHEKLLRDFRPREHSNTFSSLFIEQPIERQLRLINAALPKVRRVGVLYDAASSADFSPLKRASKERGLSLFMQEVSPKIPLTDALQEVIEHSDVLLALPDPAIYNSNTLRNILFATYRANTPLLGFSASYVKAGALCAVYSSTDQFASEAAAAIAQFADSHTLPAAHYSPLFEVGVNEQVARSLGISLPSADELRNALFSSTKGMP